MTTPVHAILDAGRDFMAIGLARLVSTRCESLFVGPKAERLAHVAPYLTPCDPSGVVLRLVLGGKPTDRGILIESDAEFGVIRAHLRRFLIVERQRDRRFVYFRYYDPRVLRPFLPACTPDELARFFGPIRAFHCRAEESGQMLTYERDRSGGLSVRRGGVEEFVRERAPDASEAFDPRRFEGVTGA